MAKPVVIFFFFFGPNRFVWLSPSPSLSITSLKFWAIAWSVIVEHILSRLWSWSVDHRLVHIISIHWSTLGILGCVSVNSKTNLNFSLPHFFQDLLHPSTQLLMVRNCRLEVSYFETQSVLIDVGLVRADTGRAARHHLVSLGTPWQQWAPPGTSWCHPVPGGTPKVPIICTSWHDLVVCRLDLILDVPLSYRTPVVVCLLEQPVKNGHCYLYEISLQECENCKNFWHLQHFDI